MKIDSPRSCRIFRVIESELVFNIFCPSLSMASFSVGVMIVPYFDHNANGHLLVILLCCAQSRLCDCFIFYFCTIILCSSH